MRNKSPSLRSRPQLPMFPMFPALAFHQTTPQPPFARRPRLSREIRRPARCKSHKSGNSLSVAPRTGLLYRRCMGQCDKCNSLSGTGAGYNPNWMPSAPARHIRHCSRRLFPHKPPAKKGQIIFSYCFDTRIIEFLQVFSKHKISGSVSDSVSDSDSVRGVNIVSPSARPGRREAFRPIRLISASFVRIFSAGFQHRGQRLRCRAQFALSGWQK